MKMMMIYWFYEVCDDGDDDEDESNIAHSHS